jgi:threonine dehydrogenase-like Zn-dependent dehydrogenase
MVTRHMGATHALLGDEGPTETPLPQRVLDANDGNGIDTTFLTVGVPALVDQAIEMAACEGRIFFVALFDRPVQLEPNALIDKHLTLLASSMYNAREIRTALDLVASRQVRAGAMVTHVLPLEEAQRAFDLAASKQEGAVKVVIEMGND